tara:strand:- start:82 stop:768 length:687 start_codon:yes stop_codon:yes gene_type:complete
VTISVIIPTLNEESTIAQTLECLYTLAHDGITLEVLVVDGGSQDRTQALVRDRARVLISAPSRAGQMNAGAREATGNVLLFLHADTLLPETALQDIRVALSDPAIVGGRFDARTDHDTGLLWIVCRLVSLRSRITRIATGDQAIFVRRDVFHSMGGYADIPLMEDVELTRRLKARGTIAMLRSCVITSARRWQTDGILYTIFLMWTFRFLFFVGVNPFRLKQLYKDIR